MMSLQWMRPWRPAVTKCIRWTALASGGGLLFQTTGGCSQTLNNLVSTLGQDFMDGVGAGVSNLAQVLALNLLI